MFENIKAENVFVNEDKTKTNRHGVNVYSLDASGEINVAKTWDEDYAKFIAYCFNLQQRYDISKLEEAVSLLEIANKPTTHDSVKELSSRIEQLLKQIKK